MRDRIDILGLGCVAIDDLLYVAAYPPADSKVQVRRTERHCGGLTATALVAASRLGARCAYAGILGEDELSQFVLDRLTAEGVDVALTRRRPGAKPIHAVIVVEEGRGSRTIFFNLEGAFGAEPGWPPEEAIHSARVLLVDHFGVEGMLRAAEVARAAGIPVVADFEIGVHPQFPRLLEMVDHLIVSRTFAQAHGGTSDPAAAVRRLWSERRQAVVVTCGAEGCWYAGPGFADAPRHQPAYAVEAIDTTGCGDVFHGAYAAALAQGADLDERIRIAAAAAALKATACGGQAGIPTRAALGEFLADAG